MVQTANQKQIKINRTTSLKEKFDDRYFTVLDAAELLNLKANSAWTLLSSLLAAGTISRLVGKGSGTTKRYKFVPPKITTLADVANESTKLQEALKDSQRVGAQPGLVTAEGMNTPGLVAIDPSLNLFPNEIDAIFTAGKALGAKLAAERKLLPSVLDVNGVKYVRMDKITEVLLAQG